MNLIEDGIEIDGDEYDVFVKLITHRFGGLIGYAGERSLERWKQHRRILSRNSSIASPTAIRASLPSKENAGSVFAISRHSAAASLNSLMVSFMLVKAQRWSRVSEWEIELNPQPES